MKSTVILKWLTLTSISFTLAAPLAPAITKVTHFTKTEHACLVKNVYHEARGEPFLGKVAVAKVTLNRATEKSVCQVVFAKNQFSWTRGKYSAYRKIPTSARYEAHVAAHEAIKFSGVGDADHFHATYVKPKWASKLKRVTQIGKHVFYTANVVPASATLILLKK